MKKTIAFALLFLVITTVPAFAIDVNEGLSQRDIAGLSRQDRLQLIQTEEEAILRKDAVARTEKNAADERVINMAMEIILGTNGASPSPQSGWNIIESSSISGQRKLELFQLLKSIFPEIRP